MNERISRVVIVGAGTMGQQIAAACLTHGFDTRLYDINDLQTLPPAFTKQWTAQIADASECDRQTQLLSDFRITTDAEAAALGADLLIEAVSEDIAIKRRVIHKFSRLCPHAIFTTTTSSFVASQMRRVAPAEEHFAVLHFSGGKPVEIMGHDRTSPLTIERLRKFTEAIGHVPIVCCQETPGAILNSMLIPFLAAGISASAKRLAVAEDIDDVWAHVTGGRGPLTILDQIGLDTALLVLQSKSADANPEVELQIQHLQEFVNNGWLGVKTNRGFYCYQNHDASTRSMIELTSTTTLSADDRQVWSVLSHAEPTTSGRYCVRVLLDPARQRFISDHYYRNMPLLPAAATFELLCKAYELKTGSQVQEIRNLEFVNGLRFNRASAENVVVEMATDGDRTVCELKHEFCNRNGAVLDPERLCSKAEIYSTRLETLIQARESPLQPQWRNITYLDGQACFLGPAMRCLKRISLSPPYAIGDIECQQAGPEGRTTDSDQHRTISFIDAAFVSCTAYVQEQLGGGLQLPVSIARIRLMRPPAEGERCQVHIQCISVSETTSEFCIQVIVGEEVLLDVAGYKCHVIAKAEACLQIAATE